MDLYCSRYELLVFGPYNHDVDQKNVEACAGVATRSARRAVASRRAVTPP